MKLTSLRRWHWIVFSLIVGPLFGYSRQQGLKDLLHNFGNSITGTRNFENLIMGKVGDRHMFEDLRVFKQIMPDDQGIVRPVYVVVGQAFMGDYEQEDGKPVAHWHPMFFATAPPYRPRMNIDQLNTRDAPKLAEQFREIPEPTVMDFLSMAGAARGIKYRHAWWYELGIGSWTLVSFVVLGLVWPTLLNFMLFRSWRRPRGEKRTNPADGSTVDTAQAPEGADSGSIK